MDPQRRRQTEDRLHILRAVQVAQTYPVEVIEIVRDSVDERDAVERLVVRFGLDEVQAGAVLDTQFRRADRKNVQRIAEEMAERLLELDE